MSLGPLMLDLHGLDLDLEDRSLLTHPTIGGVILFARNYESPAQLIELVRSIHELREPRLLVAVDQEGGRVQRFREGFTELPAAERIGARFDSGRQAGLALAETVGWLLASELRCHGIDLNFAPVLDLHRYQTGAIGERAFHRDPQTVAEIARSVVRGLAAGGMVAVGKHFPGHGSVREDSHLATPRDDRDLETVRQTDMLVFERMIHYGLAGVMSSHIVFPRVDYRAVTFSRFWLRDVLRNVLGFQGAVFSDDLSMSGAAVQGDIVNRARSALDAGCDMVLVCNDRRSAIEVVDSLRWSPDPASASRLARMRGRGGSTLEQLHRDPRFVEALQLLCKLADAG